MSATRREPSPDVSVVIPVYNSQASIEAVVSSARSALRAANLSGEFILVDDASPDNSWAVIQQLARQGRDVHGIRLRRNFGQHNAVLAGIRLARGGVIVTMDDDLQHPADDIPRLIRELERGFDVVYGFPRQQPHSIARNILSLTGKIVLQRAMGADTARHVAAFRAFRTEIREAFREYHSAYVSIDVLLTWGTHRFTWIEVDYRRRSIGRSNYTLGKLASHALTVMTGFSTVPLRLASLLGMVFTVFGIALLMFVVGRYLLQGTAVPGFPFLASAIAIFSGVQLFALGIVGEYLARIHMRTLGEPAYVIGSSTEATGTERVEDLASATALTAAGE